MKPVSIFFGGENVTEFENLIDKNLSATERFINYKIQNKDDAQDILQEVLFSAFKNFAQLKCKGSFRPWIIGIARNKCNAYYRKKQKNSEISVNEIFEDQLTYTQFGLADDNIIEDIFNSLNEKDKQILKLFVFENRSQAEISKMLNIPIGTVKSRIHTAKQNFKQKYTYAKDGADMKTLPKTLPEYRISKIDKQPFEVCCEELKGLSIIPKPNESVLWGLYNFKTKQLEEYSETKVCGEIEIHGIEGVEILSLRHDLINKKEQKIEFAAQLTDTHCRYLAATYYENSKKKHFTFLDDIFIKNWGFGENNCGNEIYIKCDNRIIRESNIITTKINKEFSDIAGRYKIEINGKSYDTICLMNLGHFENSIVIEQYLDQNGRTVLWRRFNKNDLLLKKYNKTWSEMLPDNEKLLINGEIFVHWYDCITDYIL